MSGMVKIKLLVSRAGPGVVQNAGDIIECDAAEAQRVVAAGQAELVRDGAKPETAVRRAPRAERAG